MYCYMNLTISISGRGDTAGAYRGNTCPAYNGGVMNSIYGIEIGSDAWVGYTGWIDYWDQAEYSHGEFTERDLRTARPWLLEYKLVVL